MTIPQRTMHAAPVVFFLMDPVFLQQKSIYMQEEALSVVNRGTRETERQQPVGGVLFDC